ncbi:putative glycolipid-binding domain-containing protein [Streptomyces sp. NPDC092370]|uniref:putative glycolipid-binding domain-containing protein n=1 Tax=Streptomyces sp. NPDC092370 TaxID=3366016 RepID=UPI0038138B09
MPVLRHGLRRTPGERDFLMAWVSVPDLTVRPSRQTYTHLEPGASTTPAAASTATWSSTRTGSSSTIRDRPGA